MGLQNIPACISFYFLHHPIYLFISFINKTISTSLNTKGQVYYFQLSANLGLYKMRNSCIFVEKINPDLISRNGIRNYLNLYICGAEYKKKNLTGQCNVVSNLRGPHC